MKAIFLFSTSISDFIIGKEIALKLNFFNFNFLLFAWDKKLKSLVVYKTSVFYAFMEKFKF